MIDSNEIIAYENGRNAGYSEGYEDGLACKIEKLNVDPENAILLRWNFEDMDLYTLSETMKKLEYKFPNNTIVAIPDSASLQECTKDFLCSLVDTLVEGVRE